MIRRLLVQVAKIAWFIPGVLLWASFPPMGEATDCFFALVPLLWVARRKSPRTAFRLWFANGLFFWGATLVWMPAIVKNGGPWPLVVLGWFGLAAYCALYFGVFGYLAAKAWMWANGEDDLNFSRPIGLYLRRLVVIVFGEPILWAGLEWVRGNFLGGFAWNRLGLPLAQVGLGAPAALGGVALLSALVVLVNGALTSLIERVWRPQSLGIPRGIRFIETLLPLLVLWGVYMAAQKCRVVIPDEQREMLSVGVIQRNFPCVFKAAQENPTEIYQELCTSLKPFACDLLVLPESAMSEWGVVDGRHAQAFSAWAMRKASAQALFAGGERRTSDALYNSAALYQYDAANTTEVSVAIYDKVHLVPFGEYIPGDKIWKGLQRLAPVGSCTPGEVHLLNLKTPRSVIPFGTAICYEDTDAALIRQQVRRGARFLVFITNDSWFSHSIEPVQHAWQSVVRAIETGLPIVRAGNSGVSGFILPDGTAQWLTNERGAPLLDRRGIQASRLSVVTNAAPPLTVYMQLGDIPLIAAFTVILLGLFGYWLFNKYRIHKFMNNPPTAPSETFDF